MTPRELIGYFREEFGINEVGSPRMLTSEEYRMLDEASDYLENMFVGPDQERVQFDEEEYRRGQEEAYLAHVSQLRREREW